MIRTISLIGVVIPSTATSTTPASIIPIPISLSPSMFALQIQEFILVPRRFFVASHPACWTTSYICRGWRWRKMLLLLLAIWPPRRSNASTRRRTHHSSHQWIFHHKWRRQRRSRQCTSFIWVQIVGRVWIGWSGLGRRQREGWAGWRDHLGIWLAEGAWVVGKNPRSCRQRGVLPLGNGVLARLRAAMRSWGAGLGACEGTTDDAAGSAFTFKGTGAFEDEESIRGESDGFTFDTVANFFFAFGFWLSVSCYCSVRFLFRPAVLPVAQVSWIPCWVFLS